MRLFTLLVALFLPALAQRVHTPQGNAGERGFLSGMIAHHEGTLEMALAVLPTAKDRRVLDLARDILLAQAEEMHAFRLWLLR